MGFVVVAVYLLPFIPALLTFLYLVDFLTVKLFHSLPISFCVYYAAIFLVVTMGITFNILKLVHSHLNLHQLKIQ